MKVLFLGRAGCPMSNELIQALRRSTSEVTVFLSSNRGEALPELVRGWKGDFIFAFRSLAILPRAVLDSASASAINFHPGPPEYPGSGSTNFALLEGATSFGVTAHVMDDLVDSGEILRVKRFRIDPHDDLETLTTKTHKKLFSLALQLITAALDKGYVGVAQLKTTKGTEWSGVRRKIGLIDELSTIDASISQTELRNRVRALHHPDFPLQLHLHGYTFIFHGDARTQWR